MKEQDVENVTQNNTKIREFVPEDIDKIYHLETLCHPEGKFRLEFYQIMEILQHPDVVAFVIEDDDKKIVGSFYLKLEKFLNQLWILGLNIDPGQRRKGQGRSAMATIFSIASHLNTTDIRAQIPLSSQEAIHFFSAFGFVEIKKLEDFFEPGNQGVEMSRRIQLT